MSEVVEGCWCTTCLGPMHKCEGGSKCPCCGELWPDEGPAVWGDPALDHRLWMLEADPMKDPEALDNPVGAVERAPHSTTPTTERSEVGDEHVTMYPPGSHLEVAKWSEDQGGPPIRLVQDQQGDGPIVTFFVVLGAIGIGASGIYVFGSMAHLW